VTPSLAQVPAKGALRQCSRKKRWKKVDGAVLDGAANRPPKKEKQSGSPCKTPDQTTPELYPGSVARGKEMPGGGGPKGSGQLPGYLQHPLVVMDAGKAISDDL